SQRADGSRAAPIEMMRELVLRALAHAVQLAGCKRLRNAVEQNRAELAILHSNLRSERECAAHPMLIRPRILSILDEGAVQQIHRGCRIVSLNHETCFERIGFDGL